MAIINGSVSVAKVVEPMTNSFNSDNLWPGLVQNQGLVRIGVSAGRYPDDSLHATGGRVTEKYHELATIRSWQLIRWAPRSSVVRLFRTTAWPIYSGTVMAHAAPAGAEVAVPEPPHPEGAAACPAGGDLPHIVTPCNGDANAGATRTGAVERMYYRWWVLIPVEVSLALEEASCATRGSGV